MNQDVENYIQKYSNQVKGLYKEIRTLIVTSVSCEVEEKLWARVPSYYNGERYVRIIPFKDHVNIEATAVSKYKQQLSQFKFTSKGMLQIYLNQRVPYAVLQKIFSETLLQ